MTTFTKVNTEALQTVARRIQQVDSDITKDLAAVTEQFHAVFDDRETWYSSAGEIAQSNLCSLLYNNNARSNTLQNYSKLLNECIASGHLNAERYNTRLHDHFM